MVMPAAKTLLESSSNSRFGELAQPLPSGLVNSAAERFAEADARMAKHMAEEDRAKRLPKRDRKSGRFK
jgi:hypothetical protein